MTTEETELKQQLFELGKSRVQAEAEVKSLEVQLSSNLLRRRQELQVFPAALSCSVYVCVYIYL